MFTIYRRNYKKLMKLAPDLWNLTQDSVLTCEIGALIDFYLFVTSIDQNRNEMFIYFSCFDGNPSDKKASYPFIWLSLNRSKKVAKVYTYEDSYSGVQCVDLVGFILKRKLNKYLGVHLKNWLSQGYQLQRIPSNHKGD